jgi:hypothetical protein
MYAEGWDEATEDQHDETEYKGQEYHAPRRDAHAAKQTAAVGTTDVQAIGPAQGIWVIVVQSGWGRECSCGCDGVGSAGCIVGPHMYV